MSLHPIGISSRSSVWSSRLSQAGRWSVLFGVLAIETFALSVRFEFHRVLELAGLSISRSALPYQFLRVLVVTLVAGVVLGGRRYLAELGKVAPRSDASRPIALPILIHVASLGLIAFVVGPRLLDHPRGVPAPKDLLGLVELASLMAAWLISWAALALPLRRWASLVMCAPEAPAIGLIVGLAAATVGRQAAMLWKPLRELTFGTMRLVVGLIHSDVVCDPQKYLIGNSRFRVVISAACSGFEGIGLILAFLGAYLWWYRGSLRFDRAWLLLPIGVVVIWCANIARIVALIELGTWISPEVAVGGFHSQAGWLAFNAVALGMLLVVDRSPWFFAAPSGMTAASAPARVRVENPTVPYLAPLMALVLGTMLSAAMSDGRFDYGYPLRIVLVLGVLWALRGSYAGARFEWSWGAAGIGVLVFALWRAMEPLGPSATATGRPPALAAMPSILALAWIVCRVFGSVVLVPIAEELAFRGFLLRRLIATDFEAVSARRFTWLSFLASSAAFGALHGRWLAGMMAGMAYAVCVYRRGRLGDAILAHGITNGLIAADVLVLGSWNLWG